MADDILPFGPGGPEQEEIIVEGNPLDELKVDPAILDLVQNAEGVELEDGSIEFTMEEGLIEKEQIPFDANDHQTCDEYPQQQLHQNDEFLKNHKSKNKVDRRGL